MLTPSPPPDGDVFHAPVPEETFTLPGAPFGGMLSTLETWQLLLICVTAATVIAVVGGLGIAMVKRRRARRVEDYSKAPRIRSGDTAR